MPRPKAFRGHDLYGRHYETFELPEARDRLLPDQLAITFLTDREGKVVSLSAPLEPMVKDILFARLAAGACTDARLADGETFDRAKTSDISR